MTTATVTGASDVLYAYSVPGAVPCILDTPQQPSTYILLLKNPFYRWENWIWNVYKTCQKSSRAELRFEFRQAEPTSYSKHLLGTFLAVQWLRLHTASVGGTGSIPGLVKEVRSWMSLGQKKKEEAIKIFTSSSSVSHSARPDSLRPHGL